MCPHSAQFLCAELLSLFLLLLSRCIIIYLCVISTAARRQPAPQEMRTAPSPSSSTTFADVCLCNRKTVFFGTEMRRKTLYAVPDFVLIVAHVLRSTTQATERALNNDAWIWTPKVEPSPSRGTAKSEEASPESTNNRREINNESSSSAELPEIYIISTCLIAEYICLRSSLLHRARTHSSACWQNSARCEGGSKINKLLIYIGDFRHFD